MNKLLIKLLPTEIIWTNLADFESGKPGLHAREVLVAKEKHGDDIDIINAWVLPRNNYTEYDLVSEFSNPRLIDKERVIAVGVFKRYQCA